MAVAVGAIATKAKMASYHASCFVLFFILPSIHAGCSGLCGKGVRSSKGGPCGKLSNGQKAYAGGCTQGEWRPCAAAKCDEVCPGHYDGVEFKSGPTYRCDAPPAPPSDPQPSSAPVTVEGVLVDQYCWDLNDGPDRRAIDGALLAVDPGAHTVHCLRDIKACIDSGYMILKRNEATNRYEEWYRLDAAGNNLVLAIIKSTPTIKNFRVRATGVEGGGGVLEVSSIEEAPASPTDAPTEAPTKAPTTSSPTEAGTTLSPTTGAPTPAPTPTPSPAPRPPRCERRSRRAPEERRSRAECSRAPRGSERRASR